MIRLAAALAVALPLAAAPAAAQSLVGFVDSATRKVVVVETAKPLPTIGKQESFQLVAANAPAAAVQVAGGDYVLAQTCSAYGSLTFQVLGPDAATWLPLATYNTADTGSAHAFILGSYAKVRVSLSGTSGCNALLSRVPA